jgi:hypothetical protein
MLILTALIAWGVILVGGRLFCESFVGSQPDDEIPRK